MSRSLCFGLALLGVCIGCSSTDNAATPPDTPNATGSPDASTTGATATTASYADIQALFDKSCVKCHGADNPKEGVSLVNHEALMKGGESGPTVVPGDPPGSLLIHVLRGAHGRKLMPLGGPPLPEADIQRVETWIAGGAKP